MSRDGTTSRARTTGPLADPEAATRLTDAELLGRFLSRGDEAAGEAFTALVERHGPAVRRVCLDVLGDRHEAQDAAQAAFLVLARKARSVRNPGSLGPWLHGVALRVARRARANAARRREAERKGAEAMTGRAGTGSAGGVVPVYPELHEEIDRLPEKYRAPIVLCYLQGYTQEQAARVLGWPYGTVQTRLHRGRHRLRDRLARRGIGLISVLGSTLTPPLFASKAAAVPPGWAEATGRAAVRFAARRQTGGLVDARVTDLAGAVLRGSLKTMAVRLLLGSVCVLSAVVALSARGSSAPGRDRPSAVPVVATIPSAPAPDRPLPDLEATAGRTRDNAAATDLKGRAARRVGRSKGEDRGESRYLGGGRGGPVLLAFDGAGKGGPGGAGVPDGRELFERVWTPNDPRGHGGDGLGPVFNARSCVECHDLGGPGGAGSAARNIEIATASRAGSGGSGSGSGTGFGFAYAFGMDFGAGRMEYKFSSTPASSSSSSSPSPRELPPDPAVVAAVHPGFLTSKGVVLHRFATDAAYHLWRAGVPGTHGSVVVRTSLRNPTPLFGSGLIDAIPDEVIEAAAKRKPPGSSRVKGRVSRLADGRVGRFGWKAQTATLREFVVSAAATEIGLEVPDRRQAGDPRLPGLGSPGLDMDRPECDALVAYVRGLPAPVVRLPADATVAAQVRAGEATFKAIGCAGCHLPKLGDVDGIYSDLLLHDMSPRLADTAGYGVFVTNPAAADGPGPAPVPEAAPRGDATAATDQEWRTPPLWGLRDSAPYLHDGRAATIDQAVALHGGQGSASSQRFGQLSARRKRQVEAFLLSLSAPPRGDERPGRAPGP